MKTIAKFLRVAWQWYVDQRLDAVWQRYRYWLQARPCSKEDRSNSRREERSDPISRNAFTMKVSPQADSERSESHD